MSRTIFSTRLTVLRKRKGMTQAQLASDLGLTRTAYTSYETGVSMPNVATLCALADVFDVSVDYLLGRKEDPSPYHFEEDGYAEGLMDLQESYRSMTNDRRRMTRETAAMLGQR